jgi:hypothetical protein
VWRGCLQERLRAIGWSDETDFSGKLVAPSVGYKIQEETSLIRQTDLAILTHFQVLVENFPAKIFEG